jgi:hypothetical protein
VHLDLHVPGLSMVEGVVLWTLRCGFNFSLRIPCAPILAINSFPLDGARTGSTGAVTTAHAQEHIFAGH